MNSKFLSDSDKRFYKIIFIKIFIMSNINNDMKIYFNNVLVLKLKVILG